MNRFEKLVKTHIKKQIYPGIVINYGSDSISEKTVSFGNYTYSNTSPTTKKGTIYDIASLTKIFTATLVLILASKNILSVDDEINTILQVDTFPEVTIKHLLTHTAGLQLSFSALQDKTPEEIENIALSTGPITKPTFHIYYSNQGYYLLGKIIEIKTKMSLPNAFKKYLFAPLEIKNTFFNPPSNLKAFIAPTEINEKGFIQGVVHDEGTFALGGVSGYAGLFSTAENLFKLGLFWLNKGKWKDKQIISREFVKAATTKHYSKAENLTIGQMQFGYGWRLYNETRMGKFASVDSFEFTGFTGPSLHIDPKQNLVIVIMDNRTFPQRGEREIWWNAHREITEEIYSNLE